MSKKIVRLAIIRENEEKSCPFGLFIPDACKTAGELVANMVPVENHKDLSEDQIKEIIESNKKVLMFSNDKPAPCMYANDIFKDVDKVECNFGDTAAGLGHANLNSSVPLYQYLGTSFYSVPLAFYNQDLTYNDNFTAFVDRYYAAMKAPEIKK